MNLKQLHKTLIFLLCAALVACNKTTPVQNGTDPSGKTPITLSIGGVDSQEQGTKVITDGDGKTLHALPHGSSIYMLMMADDLTPDTSNPAKCTRTIGFAQDQNPKTEISDVSFTASKEGTVFVRYWDDVYARKSAISIVAVCTPGYGPAKAGATKQDNKPWKIGGRDASFQSKDWVSIESSDLPTIIWPVGYTSVVGVADQSTPEFTTYQDLCFSNNIGNNSSGDTRLIFDEINKHFTSGKLIFYHALSKLTFNIKMGEGFSDSEFKFREGKNITLSNFYNGGTFNISDGEFANDLVRTDINKIFQRDLTSTETTEGIKFGLDALVIPGTDLSADDASSTNAVTFILAGNEYRLSMAQLYAAFSSDQKSNYFDEGKLKAGVHYVFTFTVSKTKISGITAQVVDWEDVTANNINPTNARISLQLEDRGTSLTKGVDFYRTKDTGNSAISDTYQGYNWSSGYEKGTGNFDGTTWKPTNWYWPDNTTFYHFRAVGEKKDASPIAPTVSNDAFALAAEQPYKDYIWGAPFKELDSPTPGANTTKIVYNFTNGFDGTFDGGNASTHQIYFGIGPTTDPIKLLMFHMMSDVTVNVQSVTGDGAVALTVGGEKTTIHFENIYTGGSVVLGNGLVSTTGDATTTGDLTMSSTDNQWLYGAIPQNLDGATTATTDDVILVITTPDHNQYKVSMKGVKAETVTDNNLRNPYSKVGGSGDDKDMYIIDKWYPGFKYTYTFKLSKKKIEDIKATIVGWEEVTAGDEVQIQ